MSERPKTTEQQQGDPAVAAPPGESLGEQLLREAREGQAEFVAGWEEFMDEQGIRGRPVGARELRERLLREGIRPENNEFSRGIVALREETL